MTIEASQLVFYKAENNDDTNRNGGRISTTVLASGELGALFPEATEYDRVNGAERWRKVFFKNLSSETLRNPGYYIADQPAGDEFVELWAGTNSDKQEDSAGFSGPLGNGLVATQAALGASVLVVNVKSASMSANIFSTSNPLVLIVAGVEHFLLPPKTVVQVGAQYTITLDDSETLPVLVPAGSVVASMCMNSDLTAFVDPSNIADTGLTFDGTTYPIICYNPAAAYQRYVVGWYEDETSKIAFIDEFDIITGRRRHLQLWDLFVVAATDDTYYQHNYHDVTLYDSSGRPLWTIPKECWTTYLEGSVTFIVTPATHALWLKKVTPAGAAEVPRCNITLNNYGETG